MWDLNRGGNMCSCMGDTGKIFSGKHEEKLVVMRERGGGNGGYRGVEGDNRTISR